MSAINKSKWLNSLNTERTRNFVFEEPSFCGRSHWASVCERLCNTALSESPCCKKYPIKLLWNSSLLPKLELKTTLERRFSITKSQAEFFRSAGTDFSAPFGKFEFTQREGKRFLVLISIYKSNLKSCKMKFLGQKNFKNITQITPKASTLKRTHKTSSPIRSSILVIFCVFFVLFYVFRNKKAMI